MMNFCKHLYLGTTKFFDLIFVAKLTKEASLIDHSSLNTDNSHVNFSYLYVSVMKINPILNLEQLSSLGFAGIFVRTSNLDLNPQIS